MGARRPAPGGPPERLVRGERLGGEAMASAPQGRPRQASQLPEPSTRMLLVSEEEGVQAGHACGC